jgi:hypothetical protein
VVDLVKAIRVQRLIQNRIDRPDSISASTNTLPEPVNVFEGVGVSGRSTYNIFARIMTG